MIIVLNGLIMYVSMVICELSLISVKRINAKKCNYDCEKCKNCDCLAHYCNEKIRKEEIK